MLVLNEERGGSEEDGEKAERSGTSVSEGRVKVFLRQTCIKLSDVCNPLASRFHREWLHNSCNQEVNPVSWHQLKLGACWNNTKSKLITFT